MNNRLRLPVTFTKTKEYESSDIRFLEVTVDVMHTGTNLNRSDFTKQVIEKATPTICNTPILGYIEVNEDGITDFKGHEHEVVVDDKGVHYRYAGRAYGVIPESCNPRWIIKDDGYGNEKEYLRVNGLLWTKFDDAIDIFTRDGKKNHSVELINILSQEGADGIAAVSSFDFDGCCILSTTDQDIKPAMTGSDIVANFSVDSIAAQIKEKLNEFSAIKGEFSETTPKGEIEKMKIEQNDLTPATVEPETAPVVNEVEPAQEPEVVEGETVVKDVPQEPESDPAPAAENTFEAQEDTASAVFSLTIEQLRQEMCEKIAEVTIPTQYGDTMSRYWYEDIQGDEIIVIDCTDWRTYGVSYSISGDNVTIDWNSLKRKKCHYADWEDGNSGDGVACAVTAMMTVAGAKIGAMEPIVAEYNTIKPLYDNYVAAEEEARVRESEAKRAALFAIMDEKLGDCPEYVALKENKDIDNSDLETKCYALLGKRAAEFSYKPQEESTKNVRFGVGVQSTASNTGVYGDLIERYRAR